MRYRRHLPVEIKRETLVDLLTQRVIVFSPHPFAEVPLYPVGKYLVMEEFSGFCGDVEGIVCAVRHGDELIPDDHGAPFRV